MRGRQPAATGSAQPLYGTRLTSPRASRGSGGSSECSVGEGRARARAGRGADGLRGHERARGALAVASVRMREDAAARRGL